MMSLPELEVNAQRAAHVRHRVPARSSPANRRPAPARHNGASLWDRCCGLAACRGGLLVGELHEVAGGGNGAIDGAAAALFTAGIAARTRGKVLWCVTRPDLFAPALSQAGLKSDSVIYLEARL